MSLLGGLNMDHKTRIELLKDVFGVLDEEIELIKKRTGSDNLDFMSIDTITTMILFYRLEYMNERLEKLESK